MPSNNFNVTAGSGTTIATEQGTGLEHYQKIKLIDPTLSSIAGIGISSNPLRIDPTGTTTQPISGSISISNPVQVASSNLCISITGATGTTVTATLPAVASNFHYISLIEIMKYFTAANAASATPLIVTTTNLPGSLAFTFGQPLGTIGTTDKFFYAPNSPLKSSVINTATTIVCPATTGIIWRVNVFYFAAP